MSNKPSSRDGRIVTLNNVRISFPSLFTPKPGMNGGAPRYQAAFIIDPDSDEHTLLTEAMNEAALLKYAKNPDEAEAIVARLHQDNKCAYKLRALSDKNGQPYSGFEGMFGLNASNKSRIPVVDAQMTPVDEASGLLFAGCWVNTVVQMWPNPEQYGRRINCELQALQVVKSGEALGGSAPVEPETVFGKVDVEQDDDSDFDPSA